MRRLKPSCKFVEEAKLTSDDPDRFHPPSNFITSQAFAMLEQTSSREVAPGVVSQNGSYLVQNDLTEIKIHS